jgi:hypothetical protein
MQKIIAGLFLSSLFSAVLIAQELPRIEIFGGYSYYRVPSHFGPDVYVYTTERAKLNGWNATVTGNFNRWVGVDADFGGYHGRAAADNWHVPMNGSFVQDIDINSYLFGPRLSYRRLSKITPFIHGLFGKAALDRLPISNTTKSSFGLAFGGGVDIGLARHFAIRAIQADYVRSYFVESDGKREDNLRLSVGGVVRF